MAPAKGTILLTGSNGGLGSSIVERVLHQPDIAQNYYGVYTVRKPETATAVTKLLTAGLDLAKLDNVRKAADDINQRVSDGKLPPIRALIMNAGYQEHTTQSFTNDGFDMTFQSNYLSHFLLALLLLQSMDKKHGRIVVLGSWSHDTSDPRNSIGPTGGAYKPEKYQQIFNDPINTDILAKGEWSSENEHPGNAEAGMRRYGASKLCQVLMYRELSTRVNNGPKLSHISVLAVDPGAMASSLTRRGNFLMRIIIPAVLRLVAIFPDWWNPNGDFQSTWKSGGDVVRAAFDTKTLGECPNGIYLNGSAFAEVGPEAKDVNKSAKLWRDSLGYASVKEGDTMLADWL
ncbi:uncharacterized protein BCR38DRAFT_469260 [Pseudomassariella vexata]|uniref:Short-chain dehydrogenase n=1 Tax=Pseudomassariella vexata TaxID=1141098 RepID=A0A1Y2DC58_9PEZI|nr:uncharacterized protein BCR38DRAFT_469260 [Pseudomassariella vexata]ORY56839.1 hypothetical protein BCR38DRAFT_469260 [Pseudomassariella vexata]